MSAVLRAELRQTGPSTTEGTVRGHRVAVDRPVEKGGGDGGPMGGELLLLALGGCFASNLLAAIRAREADVEGVRVVVEATLEGTPPRMSAFTLRVSARHEDADLLAKLVTIAERGCIVANTLRQSAPLRVVVEPAS